VRPGGQAEGLRTTTHGSERKWGDRQTYASETEGNDGTKVKEGEMRSWTIKV